MLKEQQLENQNLEKPPFKPKAQKLKLKQTTLKGLFLL